VPACQRCISAGRLCEGYDPSNIATLKPDVHGSPAPWFLTPSSIPKSSPNERAAFQAFRDRCGKISTGILGNGPLHDYILQTAHSESVVWHSIVALEAAQKQEHALAFQQYSRAVREIREKVSTLRETSDAFVVLLTCLLLIPFELMHEGYDQAKTHTYGAFRIIQQLRRGCLCGSRELPQPVIEAFERLDVADSLFKPKRTELYGAPHRPMVQNLGAGTSFGNVADVGPVMAVCMAFVRELRYAHLNPDTSTPPNCRQEFESIVAGLFVALENWSKAMEALEVRLTDPADHQRLRVYRMYYHYCYIRAKTLEVPLSSEMIWDDYLPQFDAAVKLARDFLDTAEAGERQLAYPFFSLHIGIIPPLYLIATKCRDPRIRHEALDLLQRCKHREGCWNGPKAFAIVRLMVAAEDEGLEVQCCADVPESRRRCVIEWNANNPEAMPPMPHLPPHVKLA
jgi:hypothetical protein